MPSIAPPHHTRTATTSDCWITPRWIVDRLGPFDLDPCECIPQPWPCAARSYTIENNGLLMPWEGLVWCNPPYGAAAFAWLDRMALHNNGIALVFARTETRMFFDAVWARASSVLFIRGRLNFARPDGNYPRNGASSGGPSVLIAYGETADERLQQAADIGQLVTWDKRPRS